MDTRETGGVVTGVEGGTVPLTDDELCRAGSRVRSRTPAR